MRQINTGHAGALLVFVALFSGGFALWTASDPASGQEGEQPATTASATVPEGPVQPDETPQQQLDDILSMLATGGQVPSELQDPVFDYYVDLRLLGDAWVELDAPMLADLALQFVEGERVLLRSHHAIRAVDLMEVAIRTAAIKFDEDTLARLEKAVARMEDADLQAELAKAKTSVKEGEGESAWMLPVATTSAAEFAQYKGVLQDIEAAIVTRDRATLEALQAELQSTIALPESHREILERKITQALNQLADVDQVSKAAQVLDKLAHATRSYPPGDLPEGSGYLTPPGGGQTQTPQSPTQCQAVSTACPEGSVATQCPAVLTRCPINVTSCPLKVTRCPSWASVCPPESCESPTQRPNSPTQCQQVQTQCQQAPTQCQQIATQCWQSPTQCQQVATQCQQSPTQCQQVATQCRQSPTQCQQVATQCQQSPTQCQQVATQCRQSPTQCQQTPTQCQQAPTQCKQVPTQCKQQPTQCNPQPTQCIQVPTQCSPQQGTCERPTLVPYVPTQCPAIQTRCPYSPSSCPPSCGQQQQKQRWIPPRKGKYRPSGSPEQSTGRGASGYSVTPYPRRYD